MTNKMIGVSDFQILDQGERMLLSLDGPNQEFTQFAVETDLLPKIVQAIVHNWKLATHVRRTKGEARLDATAAWKVTGTEGNYVPTSHLIAVQLATDVGIPIVATMDTDRAKELIHLLTRCVAEAPQDTSSARLN